MRRLRQPTPDPILDRYERVTGDTPLFRCVTYVDRAPVRAASINIFSERHGLRVQTFSGRRSHNHPGFFATEHAAVRAGHAWAHNH